MCCDKFEVLLILFTNESEGEQDTPPSAGNSAHQDEGAAESCLFKALINEYYITIGQVVFPHGVGGEEKIVEPAWLLGSFFHC